MGRYISRAFAVFFVLLFILIASLSACTAAFRDTLINVDTYKQVFVEQDLYEDIVPYVIPAILRNSQETIGEDAEFLIDLNDIASVMTTENWRAVSEELIPAEWLQTQTESVLDTLNQISMGNLEQAGNIIDVTEVIERLQGQEGRNASKIIIASAPDCNARQVIQLRNFEGNPNETFPLCNPPTQNLRNRAEAIISQWFSQIGIVLNMELRQQDNALVIPEDYARLIYNLFQLDSQLSLLLLLCPLTLIGFIMVLAVRNLTSFGRWIGWTFIITGIITLFLIFTSQVPVFESFDDVVRASSEIERFEAQIYAGFARSVYQDASSTMLALAGGLIAIGFLLLAVSLLGRSHNYIVPEGSVLVTPDGKVISTATQQAQKTVILDKDS